MISLHASASLAICAKHVPMQKPVLIICILVTEINLKLCISSVVQSFVSTVKSHIPNTWKRVRRSQGGAGMFSVLEPVWPLLLLMPEINLCVTALPPRPNKRKMVIANGFHTSHPILKQGLMA